MNTSPTLVIVAGFAYALENVKKIIKFEVDGINHAYLFSYESRLRNRYLGNLMELALECTHSPEDEWIKNQALRYAQNPITKREEFFEICRRYFFIQKTSLAEDTFDYSYLNQEGRSLGKEIYRDHFLFFHRFVTAVCRRQSSGAPESSCGIIFTSKE